jgi:hypothetical protein
METRGRGETLISSGQQIDCPNRPVGYTIGDTAGTEIQLGGRLRHLTRDRFPTPLTIADPPVGSLFAWVSSRRD